MSDDAEDRAEAGSGSRQRLARFGRPFDPTDAAHTVVRVAEALGWDLTDPDRFLRRAQHVEFGLSAEIEFAAILRWLGTCCFIHRLDEDVLADKSRICWRVPDLFAVFVAGEKICSTLIEVKTTKDLDLTFRKDYLEGLKSYADLHKQPLLIAWRPMQFDFWMLVDPGEAQLIDGEKVKIDIDLALKNDLMGLLAGDYLIIPMSGAGLRVEAKRVSEKNPTADGYEAIFEITKTHFHDASGAPVDKLPAEIQWLVLSEAEHHQHVDEVGWVQSFVAPDTMTRAQRILRVAVGFQLEDEERIHWRDVERDLDNILRCEKLLTESQARFGTFVKYIILQKPLNMPAFLPAGWRSSERAKGEGTRH